MSAKSVLCLGAANVDVKALPRRSLVRGHESEGSVEISVGGVARNVAENLSRLGVTTSLVSRVGADFFADVILRQTGAAGVRLDLIERVPQARTGSYVAILNPDGTPDYAVGDCALLDGLTLAVVARHQHAIDAADLVVLDAHVPAEVVAYLATCAHRRAIPLYLNATSLARAPQLVPLLPRIGLLSANRQEAEAMLGTRLGSIHEAANAATELVRHGAREVLLTLGAEGVLYSGPLGTFHHAVIPARVVEVTGAGDALAAAYLAAWLAGCDLPWRLANAVAAASLTVESPQSVAPHLSVDAVEARRVAGAAVGAFSAVSQP